MSDAVIRPAGDSALLVEFENEISLEVNSRVRALKFSLEKTPFEGMGELLPAYRSLLVFYDPLKIRWKQAQEEVLARLGKMDRVSLPKAIVTEIPVCYDKEYAVDLEHIAQLEHKSEEEIIRIHSGSDYFVYMLGFAPGHPYTARFENPFLLQAGQWIRHKPISKEEYLDIKKQVEAGTYVCRSWEKED